MMANIDDVHMHTAQLYAAKSKAIRAKVGAVLVTESGIILPGFNGTAIGTSNECEDENGITKIETIHAELNCIIKAAKEGVSIKGATLYVTLSPCRHCSALMIQSGIKRVVYLEQYRDSSGIDYLRENGIDTSRFLVEL